MGYDCPGSQPRNARVRASASGAMASPHLRASGVSQLCVSCTRARAQPQPCGRSARASALPTNSASAASATGVNWAPSADRIPLPGTSPGTVRSSRSRVQCIWTEECQSKLP